MGRTTPQNRPFLWVILSPSNSGYLGPASQPPKRHFDHFSRFHVHCSKTPNAFEWAGQPPKSPLPLWGSEPHIIHGSLGPLESTRKWHLDLFSRLWKAHEREQQTDTYTQTRPRYSVCNSSQHLM